MNKKIITSLALAGVISLGFGAGTLASYKRAYTSNNNTVHSAKFNVDISSSKGKFTDSAFTILGADLKPGTINKEVYDFEVDKDTDVNVAYQIKLSKDGDLFAGKTPITLSLQQFVNGTWQEVSSDYKYAPSSDKEKFRIILNWPMETEGINDIDYAGKEGKVGIIINAAQAFEMSNSFASVTAKSHDIKMTYKGDEGSDVTVKILGSKGNPIYFDQGVVTNGICEFNTTLDDADKYTVTMNGSKGMATFSGLDIK